MSGSFTQKQIEVRLTLNKGSFNGGGNQKIVSGLAVSAEITKTCLPAKNSAVVTIIGIQPQDMEPLTTLAFRPLEIQHNKIEIHAGDAETGMSCVFMGDITSAAADFNSQPDVKFKIEALTNFLSAVKPAPLYTYKGEIPASNIFERLAKEMGQGFENKGVDVKVRDIALSGSPWSKAVNLSKQIGCELILDDDAMWIAPNGKQRGKQIPLWNKDTGLKGFPTFSQKGISATHLFDPSVICGGKVKIETVVPKATGEWRVFQVKHHIEAYKPSGKWETTIDCMYGEGR